MSTHTVITNDSPGRTRDIHQLMLVNIHLGHLFIILNHDDVIKWKHFPRNWTFMRGIHRSPVNSPHKGQWRGALMFTLICARINGWVNTREAGDLGRYRPHYDVIVMPYHDEFILRNIKYMFAFYIITHHFRFVGAGSWKFSFRKNCTHLYSIAHVMAAGNLGSPEARPSEAMMLT